MAKLILTRGVPASGKSTWAKAWVAEDPENRLRVNRDNLRWTLGIKTGVGNWEQENEVSHWEKAMVRRGLQSGKDVVVDATNLRAKHVKEWLWLASDENVSVEFKDFPITLEDAITRNKRRFDEGLRSVEEGVVRTFFLKFIGKDGSLPPVPQIEAKELPTGSYKPYTHTEGLPRAIIVDIDGTTAHMTGRSPYDPSLYHTDEPDVVLRDLIDAYEGVGSGIWLIYVSGRNEDYREATEAWLEKHNFHFDEFYMRPSGDNRNDAIVKDELFEKHIAGRFNIDFVLDDRNRVVEMWRAKGLKVLQVADGDF